MAAGRLRVLKQRWVRKLGWLVGAPLAIFRFLRRQTPVEVVDPADRPAPLSEEPAFVDRDEERAVGPVIHRLYRAIIPAPKLSSPQRLMAIIAPDPNVIAPVEVLRF